MTEEKKVDVSAFEFTEMEFDPETGNEVVHAKKETMTVVELEKALDVLSTVMQDFIQDFNHVMNQVGERMVKLEEQNKQMFQILQMTAQRTDWMMEGKTDLIDKERQFLLKQKELIESSKNGKPQ